jgi:hypothetical protein
MYNLGSGGGQAARGIPGGRGGARGVGRGSRGGRVSTKGRGSTSGQFSANMNTYNSSYDAGTPADNEYENEEQSVDHQYQTNQRSVANSANGRVSNNNRSQQSAITLQLTEEENAGHVISKVFFENEQLLIDNMKEKEEYFETAGLLVINEDEKDIKGKYINLRKTY